MKTCKFRGAGCLAVAFLCAGLVSCAGSASRTEARQVRAVAMAQMLAVRDAASNEGRQVAIETADRFITATALDIHERAARSRRLVSDDELRILFRWKALLHRGEARIVPSALREYFVEPAPRLYMPVP